MKRYKCVPRIPVGKEVDLEGERDVLDGTGKALAEEWSCPVMETLAKKKALVGKLFAKIWQQMN